MSGELRISETLTLPVDSVTQTFGVLAKRGMGKTYTAAVMVEEMLQAGLHVVVCDPVGVWWGLRSNAAGDGPGLPIAVLGGDHADLPLDVAAGEAIANLVVDQRLSVVLDLSLLRKGEQTRFMTDFCETLYRRNRSALHLVLDEADTVAPQQPMPDQRRLSGAVEDLVRRGRARGIGVTLITQRPAVLSKNVLTQIEVLITLRLIAPQDRTAIDEWVRVHGTADQREQLMQSLPSLDVGEAWFWSPGWLDLFQRLRIRKRRTFDSSATPKAGESVITPRELAPVDLAALREHLAAAADPAESSDPKTLRARIRELERELRERPRAVEVERVEVPVLPVEDQAMLVALVGSVEGVLSRANELRDRLWKHLPAPPAELAPTPVPEAPAAAVAPAPARPAPSKRESKVQAPAGVQLRAGERKMLATLARMHPQALTRQQLATLTSFAVGGGTFGTYLSVLRKAGLLTESGGQLHLTPAGLASVPDRGEPPTTEEILGLWRSNLRAGERRILDALIDVYPREIERNELAIRTEFEPTGGTYGTYLSVLRRNGLVEERQRKLRASPTLFLGGER